MRPAYCVAYRRDRLVEPEDTLKIEGEVLSEEQFDALAEISPEDIEQALKDFDRAVPKPFKGMLDADD